MMSVARISRFSALLALAAVTLLPAPARGEKGFALDAKRRVLAPIAYKNLTLLPVVRRVKPKKPSPDLLVLDEGMKRGLVEIVEKEGGDVNQLVVENRSDRPLFLMAGEVVIGGKQDRIIGKDTVIPKQSTEPVPVFCVEHGRWSGRKASFESAGAMAHTKLRNNAKYKDQGKVWAEVSAENAKKGTENATDTYRQVAQGKKVKETTRGYQRHFEAALAKLPERADMIGFVVVLNGQVVAIETFQSPKLFGKLSGKLLESYYVEAVDEPVAKKIAKPSPKQVQKFAASAKRAKRKVVHASKAAETYQLEADGVVGSEVKAPAAKPDEDAVYQSAYAE